jgi:hypothetical protein
MTDNDTILMALDSIRQANHDSHNEIRNSIIDGLHGVQMNIDANATVTNDRIDGIIKRLDKLNGSVGELWTESNKRADVIKEFRQHQKFGQWVHKNWWAVALIFIGAVVLIVTLIDYIGLRGLWDVVKEIK